MEYNRNYYKENRERILEQKKEYYERTREEKLAYREVYYQENKEELIQYARKYYRDNKDKIRKYNKKYRNENRELRNTLSTSRAIKKGYQPPCPGSKGRQKSFTEMCLLRRKSRTAQRSLRSRCERYGLSKTTSFRLLVVIVVNKTSAFLSGIPNKSFIAKKEKELYSNIWGTKTESNK